ncbi:Motility protein B [Anatilimnocola aggregata]|uniref:Motility protein B n=1 Tax=Anatilimnocola aggregata TaxID=2528021 RepID=A0A517Y4W1_9BACT|nr:flagellar motor protein MotB [Anatilimnocola aggregata]QDU25288.1 Motility protein B [Anatilimnocola aggregata]
MAGGGGGAWKVAYADFVTAMMAFFMVMWLVGQKEDLKEAVAHHFNHPFEAFPEEPDDDASGAGGPRSGKQGKRQTGFAHRMSLTKSPTDPEARKPRMLTIREGQRTGIGTIIFFKHGSTELNDEAQERLNLLLPRLAGKPQKVEVRGHASRRPLPAASEFDDAWQLSYARAMATMKYLEEGDVAPDRMRLSQGGVFEPYTTAVKEEQKYDPNDRVEILMLSEFAQDLNGTAAERAAAEEAEKTTEPKAAGH